MQAAQQNKPFGFTSDSSFIYLCLLAFAALEVMLMTSKQQKAAEINSNNTWCKNVVFMAA